MNGGTPQQIISPQFLVLKLGVSQYPTCWRHPIRYKRSLDVHYLTVCQLPSGPTGLPEHMRRLEPPLGVVIFKGKMWKPLERILEMCIYHDVTAIYEFFRGI